MGEYPSVEIIVVDNFSSDRTGKIALNMGANFIQRRCDRAEARNIGLLHSSGNYVLFLDADQKLWRGTITECIKTCVEKNVDAVKIPELFVGRDFWGECTALWKNYMVEAWGSNGGIPRFYNAKLIDRNRAFRVGLAFWEDIELYERLEANGVKAAWCNGLIIHYEDGDLRETVRKYFLYGKSSATLPSDSAKRNIYRTVNLTLKTLSLLLRKPRRPLRIYLGTFLMAAIKAVTLSLGFLSKVFK